MALEATSWTTTRVLPTHNAPFAGLAEDTPLEGFQTSEGVALVVLALGAMLVWGEVWKSKRKAQWP